MTVSCVMENPNYRAHLAIMIFIKWSQNMSKTDLF